jgi:hypothetical protein
MKDIRNYLDKLAVKLASQGMDELAFDVWSAGTSVMKYASANAVDEAKNRYFRTKGIDEFKKYYESGQMLKDIDIIEKSGMTPEAIKEKKFEIIQRENDPNKFEIGAREIAETLRSKFQKGAIRAASLILSKMACHLKDLGYDKEASALHYTFAKIAAKGRMDEDKKEHFQVMSLEEMYEKTTHKAEQKPILDNIKTMVKTYESVLRLIKEFKKEYEKLTKAYINSTGEEVSDSELNKFSNKMIKLITYYDSKINGEFKALAKAMA